MPELTGTLIPTTAGVDLVLERSLDVDASTAWQYVADSDKCGEWFGTWTRDGDAVDVVLMGEEGTPTSHGTITKCVEGRLVELATSDESGGWQMRMDFEDVGDGSVVTFTHHLTSTDGIGEIGPGWEWYLDRFASAVAGGQTGPFEEYYPSLKDAYERLAR